MSVKSALDKLGFKPFVFQKECIDSVLKGQDTLIHSKTGSGKTLAALLSYLELRSKVAAKSLIWITPLRALAKDLFRNISEFCEEVDPCLKVGLRTSDTSSTEKTKQLVRLPDILVTTPESLSILLAQKDSLKRISSISQLVIDEWHELLGSKRGVLLELALSTIRFHNPSVLTLGLSATLGNPEQALAVLSPHTKARELITSPQELSLEIKTLIPEKIESFPYRGHLGIKLVKPVLEELKNYKTALLFTNTRSQAELWFKELVTQAPELEKSFAIHHGSLDKELRLKVEEELLQGELKLCVCTSSLELGIDFPPVEAVFQLGSPRGFARFLQRAGRSGHQPGKKSKVILIPTNAFELLEFSALKRSLFSSSGPPLENREALENCIDVLLQHLVSLSCNSKLKKDEALDIARNTFSFRALKAGTLDWCFNFLSLGGDSLRAYPQYHKLKREDEVFLISSPKIKKQHLMQIGAITSEGMLAVKYAKGGTIGHVEESFLSSLKPGDKFLFSGKVLSLIQIREMAALVRNAKADKKRVPVPRYLGGRLPLSTELAEALRQELNISEDVAEKDISIELKSTTPLLEIQRKASAIPKEKELLVERIKLKEGSGLFIFPFEGRLVHEGLALLISKRISDITPTSITIITTDYGMYLSLSEELIELDWKYLLSDKNLLKDCLEALNHSEMGKRKFRDIAQISGLTFQGYPGKRKTAKQQQVSSSALYDVFKKYEPSNLLYKQASLEVLESMLEINRLRNCLKRIKNKKLLETNPKWLTPFSFPLWAENLSAQISSEKLSDRIDRMLASLEKKYA